MKKFFHKQLTQVIGTDGAVLTKLNDLLIGANITSCLHDSGFLIQLIKIPNKFHLNPEF